MFNLFGKKEETVSLTDHVHIVAEKVGEARKDLQRELQRERETVGRHIQRNRELQTQLLAARAEAEANKVDAEAHRRSKANLKQFRKAEAKPMDAGTF